MNQKPTPWTVGRTYMDDLLEAHALPLAGDSSVYYTDPIVKRDMAERALDAAIADLYELIGSEETRWLAAVALVKAERKLS